MNPILLLKTRVMTDPRFRDSGGVLDTAKAACRIGASVIHNEGALALMKGSSMFAMKRVADWTSRYFFVIAVESAILKSRPQTFVSVG